MNHIIILYVIICVLALIIFGLGYITLRAAYRHAKALDDIYGKLNTQKRGLRIKEVEELL